MKNTLNKMAIGIEAFNRLMYWFSAIAILVASLVLTYEVILRYFLAIPTIWEVEFSVYLGVLATFMGAAYGLKDNAHISIDLVTSELPPKIRGVVDRVTSMLSAMFCLLITYYSWRFWWVAFSKGWRSESLWGPPLAIPYFFLPLGMTLLSLQYIIKTFGLGKAREDSSAT